MAPDLAGRCAPAPPPTSRRLRRIVTVYTLTFAVAASGCGGSHPDAGTDAGAGGAPETLDEVAEEITAMTWAFHRADTARDPDALVGLMWPDFAMRVDGEMLGFAEASSGLRAFMENLEEFATEWTDLRVVPLTRSTAVSSFLFRDSVVTKSGEILRTAGPTTFVWERRGKAWRLRFVDADHQIIENDG